MISPTNRKSKVWSVVRVSSGNFLEMYDFMVFGYYASAIGNAFFPGGNPFVSLMLSLMTFGAWRGVVLSSVLPPQKMMLWGWRIPLLLGCAILPFLFRLRRSLQETDEFIARTHRPSTSEILTSLTANWEIVLIGTMMVTMTTVSFYMITAYTPTFGSSVLHLASIDSLIVTLCVGASNLLWLPVMGTLSDRIGRRPLLVVCTTLMLITAYPTMLCLVRDPSFSRLLAIELWLSFIFGSYNGAMVVFLSEIMPMSVRTTGFALAYSLATAVFGGFTPAISTYLIHVTGNRAVPGLWLSLAASCGLVASLLARPHQAPEGPLG